MSGPAPCKPLPYGHVIQLPKELFFLLPFLQRASEMADSQNGHVLLLQILCSVAGFEGRSNWEIPKITTN